MPILQLERRPAAVKRKPRAPELEVYSPGFFGPDYKPLKGWVGTFKPSQHRNPSISHQCGSCRARWSLAFFLLRGG